jgi:hypothetical protein
MAIRQRNAINTVDFTFTNEEMTALMRILNKISRDKTITNREDFTLCGAFIQLFELDRDNGEYRILRNQ